MEKRITNKVLSLASYIDCLKPSLAEIISPESLRSIIAVAGELPCVNAGFELRLTHRSNDIDLLLKVANRDFSRAAFENIGLFEGPINKLYGNKEWMKISRFCSRWRTESEHYDPVNSVWCELDSKFGRIMHEKPSVFLGFKRDHQKKISKSGGAVCFLNMIAVTPISRDVCNTLNRCIRSLPESVSVYQYGVMQGRNISNSVRICSEGWSEKELKKFLVGMKYEGCIDRCTSAWKTLSDKCGLVCLAFSVSECMDVSLGFECFAEGSKNIRDSWPDLFLFLNENNLCDQLSLAKFVSWPGIVSKYDIDIKEWPINLLCAERIIRNVRESVIYKVLSHIKVGFDGKKLNEAKAYFGFQVGWR